MGFVKDIFGGGSKGGDFQAQSAPVQNQWYLGDRAQTAQNVNSGLAKQQQSLADTLMAQANGAGPNPAQAEYQKNINANAARSAGMISSQKGISPALAARLVNNQAGQANQGAAADASINRANQTLAAQTALGSNLNNQATNSLQQQQILQQALTNQNNAAVQNASQQNSSNAAIAAQNAKDQNGGIGGLISGLGGIAGTVATGGLSTLPSAVAGAFAKGGKVGLADVIIMKEGGSVPGQAKVAGDSPANDTVKALLSPGEIVIPRTKANSPEAAKQFVEQELSKENKMSQGGTASPAIDPEKARQVQAGASESGYQPAKWAKNVKEGLGLSQGGKVEEFLSAISASKKEDKDPIEPAGGYAKVLSSHRKLDARLKKLEEAASKLKKK